MSPFHPLPNELRRLSGDDSATYVIAPHTLHLLKILVVLVQVIVLVPKVQFDHNLVIIQWLMLKMPLK